MISRILITFLKRVALALLFLVLISPLIAAGVVNVITVRECLAQGKEPITPFLNTYCVPK